MGFGAMSESFNVTSDIETLALSTAQIGQRMRSITGGSNNPDGSFSSLKYSSRELDIHSTIFHELSQKTHGSKTLPESARACMQLFADNNQELNELLSNVSEGAPWSETIQGSFDAIAAILESQWRSISALRTIIDGEQQILAQRDLVNSLMTIVSSTTVSESTTVDLDSKSLAAVETFKKLVKIPAENGAADDSHSEIDDSHPTSSNFDSNINRPVEEPQRQLAARHRNDTLHPWLIEVYVLRADAHEPVAALIKIDTQSARNWVSTDLLKRMEVGNAQIRPYEDEFYYEDFFSRNVRPTGVARLTWYAMNIGKTRETDFLISPNSSNFDLLLGNEYFFQEGFGGLFREPISAIREVKLTKDEVKEMQATLTKCEAINEDIASERRAKAAKGRDKRRQEKAAVSRAASSAATGTPSASSLPTGPLNPSVMVPSTVDTDPATAGSSTTNSATAGSSTMGSSTVSSSTTGSSTMGSSTAGSSTTDSSTTGSLAVKTSSTNSKDQS